MNPSVRMLPVRAEFTVAAPLVQRAAIVYIAAIADMGHRHQEEHMTDHQFQQILAAQLAQIALLQAIEANVSCIAHKHVPNERIHPNWKKAQELFKLSLQEITPAAR